MAISRNQGTTTRRRSYGRSPESFAAGPYVSVASLIVVCMLLGACRDSAGRADADEAPNGLYVLFVPAFVQDDGPATGAEPHLVRVVGDGKTKRIRRVLHPENYLWEYSGQEALEKAVRKGRLEHDLQLKQKRSGRDVRIEGAVLLFGGEAPLILVLSLAGEQVEPGVWKGEGSVRGGMLGELPEEGYRSEWSMQPAPPSVVYDRMVRALQFLRDHAGAEQIDLVARKAEGPALQTKEEYVTLLRSEEPEWPRRGLLPMTIDSQFRLLIAEALEEEQIEFRDGKFFISDELKKSFEDKKPLREIDITVTYEGKSWPATMHPTEREEKTYPRIHGSQIRSLASYEEDLRQELLASGGKQDAEWMEKLDYTWAELKYIPDVAYLAEHMTTVPEDLLPKAMEWFIEDGSLEYFPGMSFEELALVPNPILLMACLPHMEREQAEELAQTERVANLLKISGLGIEEIAHHTIPMLVAKVLEPLPADEAQQLVDETPKFHQYLKVADNEDLQSIIREKGLAPDED